MTRQNLVLMTVALLLGAVYVYFFTDWMRRPRIQMISQLRPYRPLQGQAAVYPLSIAFDAKYRLSSVKVVKVAEYETNKNCQPVWHLVSATNSAPVRGFLYGKMIPGMHLAKTNYTPQGLEPGANYRMIIESGRAIGELDFKTIEQ